MSTNNANNSGAVNKKPSTTSGEPPKAGRVDAPSGNTNKKSDVHFDSTEIGKNKTEYFVNVEGEEERKRAYIEQRKKEISEAKKNVEKAKLDAKRRENAHKRAQKRQASQEKRRTRIKKVNNFLFAKKRKYISIPIIVLIVAILIAIPFFIHHVQEEQRIQAESDELVAERTRTGNSAQKIKDEADAMIKENGLKAWDDATKLFEEALENASDSEKIPIAIRYTSFLYEYNKDPEECILILERYLDLAEDDVHRSEYFTTLVGYCETLKDEERVEKYRKIARANTQDDDYGIIILDGKECHIPLGIDTKELASKTQEELEQLCIK